MLTFRQPFLRRFPHQYERSSRFTLTTPTYEVVHWCNPRLWVAVPAGNILPVPSIPRAQSARVRYLQSALENLKTCPERAKRVEWIEIVVVPVVQRIEQGFLRPKRHFCWTSL